MESKEDICRNARYNRMQRTSNCPLARRERTCCFCSSVAVSYHHLRLVRTSACFRKTADEPGEVGHLDRYEFALWICGESGHKGRIDLLDEKLIVLLISIKLNLDCNFMWIFVVLNNFN